MVDLVKPTNGPEKIYLDTNDEGERVWCQDDDPAGTGYPWIEYIRHDAHEAALSSARAEIERLREALTPFAAAWNVHSQKPDVLRHLTLGDLGSLAKHHVDGIHFKNAAALIREQEE